jgi:anti-anti-sigma factor
LRQEALAGLCIDWWLDGNVAQLVLAGELDVANAALLAGVLDTCVAEGALRIEVDLAGATFIGVAGVRPLLEAANRAPGSVALRRLRPFHRRLFELCDPTGRIGADQALVTEP